MEKFSITKRSVAIRRSVSVTVVSCMLFIIGILAGMPAVVAEAFQIGDLVQVQNGPAPVFDLPGGTQVGSQENGVSGLLLTSQMVNATQWWNVRFDTATTTWTSEQYLGPLFTEQLPSAPTDPTLLLGLKGEYFNDITLTSLKLTRIDPTLDFNWASGSPDPLLPVDNFSIRWTGKIVPRYSQTYTFYSTANDGSRVWVNGVQIINDWTSRSSAVTKTGTIALTAGQMYDIKVEFFTNSGNAQEKLEWSSTSQTREVVPQSQLMYVLPPTVAFAASPSDLSSGNSATLAWTSNNADTCTGVNFVTGGAVSGFMTVSPLTTTTYQISCTGAGGTVNASTTVAVVLPLTALVTANPLSGTLDAPATVAFTGSVAGGVGPYTYNWNFGDDGNSTLQNPSHTYTSAGSYNVVFTVTDAAQTITQDNTTYVVSVAIPLPTVSFAASPSSIVSGQFATLGWTSANTDTCTGTGFSTDTLTAGSVSVTPLVTTTYQISCTGSGGTKTASTTVTVLPALSGVTVTASPSSGVAPLIVAFTSVPQGGVGPYTYAWNFGDGGNSTLQNPSHTYTASGTYSVLLTVTDAVGGSASATKVVTVTAPAVTATLTANPTAITLGQSSTITWSSANATACTGTGFSTGNAVSGSVAVSPTLTTTYQVSCAGVGGSSNAGITVTVNAAAPTNLALNRPATASSIESSSLSAALAVDGKTTTRWSSTYSNPQWLYVDLGNRYALNRVVLTWEAAYGKSYQIQVSDDATTWTTIYTTTSGDGGTDDIALSSGTGRYVRMYGTVRGTSYGYSLWELAVYGTPAGTNPMPTATLTANPTAITLGQSSTITWSSANATACTGTGFSTGNAVSGSVAVSPTLTTTYQVSCTGTYGTASTSATVTVQAPTSVAGLKGEYFGDISLGALILTRTDATVNFNWGTTKPDTTMPSADNYSVRWTGKVMPQYSQTYTFYTTSDDGIRLWVNGVQIINNWTDHGSTVNSGTIALTANQKYDIKLEYYEHTNNALAKLEWQSSSRKRQVVPQTNLSY